MCSMIPVQGKGRLVKFNHFILTYQFEIGACEGLLLIYIAIVTGPSRYFLYFFVPIPNLMTAG